MQSNDRSGRRGEPDSLAPVQLERASLEEDLAGLRRGNGTPLVLSFVLAMVAAVGGIRWLGDLDRHQAYARAANRLELITNLQGEAFLRCALPNMQRSQLSSTQALHTAIENASERFDKYYGTQLKACSHYLGDLSRELAAVNVPRDARLQLKSLRQAAHQYGHTWDAYQQYLLDPAQNYDYVKATPMIEKITLAWADYRTQQAQITTSLRAHE